MTPSPLPLGPRNSARRITARIAAAATEAGLALDQDQERLVGEVSAAAARALAHRAKNQQQDNFYIYGPPGRGKSWILGALHEALQTEKKRRLHFHEFFRDLHALVHGADLSGHDGQPAVEKALDELLGDTRVLCFDELHVHDPGDAMFFARTLNAVFARGILLIATSNYAPDDLLPNEYFHHLFEPTIELIASRMRVTRLDGGTDYRTLATPPLGGTGYNAGHLLVPGTERQLRDAGLTVPTAAEETAVRPTTHSFTALRAAGGQAWFDFRDLCDAPSAATDYFYLARNFSHVVIDGVPGPDRAGPSAWKRLANLIDVLYDRDVRTDLICMATPDPDAAGGHPVDAARLASRLAALRAVGGATASGLEPAGTDERDN